MRNRGVRAIQCDRGATLVEFAVSSLFFFMIAFSLIEGSRAVSHYNIVASVARDGARWAAVRGAASGRAATVDQIRTYVQSRALGLQVNVAVNWSPSNQPGGIVDVTVTHQFVTVAPLTALGNLNVSAPARGIVLR